MTPEQAAALREPFPTVQKVKKEWTTKTGEHKSITLDYISHAVVTDRLLSVDPGFSFEPLTDERGFPIVVVEGLSMGDKIGVWGRLTILGVSVVEFCGGKDLLDAYSRCLCRCAMRRGVALDLWIKDDEFKSSGAAGGAAPLVSDEAQAGPDPRVPAPEVRIEGPRVLQRATGWPTLTRFIAEYDEQTVDWFTGFEAATKRLMFGDREKLERDEKMALFNVCADAALVFGNAHPANAFPPPELETIRQAFTDSLGQVLALPGEE